MSNIASSAADARDASATPWSLLSSLRSAMHVAALAAAGLTTTSNAPLTPDTHPQDLALLRTTAPAKWARLRESDVGPVIATGTAALAANRQRAFDGKLEPVAPFRFSGSSRDFERAVDCLAAAAFYEAGDDPSGQAAVAQVVINRVRHPAYPNSLCAVVFEGSERETGCQFTFTCDDSLARRARPAAWERARKTAMAALAGHVDARVGTATHYHADYVLPYWAGSLRKLTQIGAHIFYRWPGSVGSSAALRDPAGAPELNVAALGGADERDDLSADAGVEPHLADLTAALTLAPAAPQQAVARPSSTIMTIADQGLPPGRWAIKAMDACSGRDPCVVLAYGGADALQRNLASDAASREAPVFLFVRDVRSGVNLALWDCTRVQRPSSTQCLPSAPPALARLLRDRG